MKLKSRTTSICACLNASTDAEDADERGVLLQPDEVVQERRDHPAHRLRQDDVTAAPGSASSPSERAAASWLGCTDSIPAR